MSKIYTFLADGFEEIEALAPVDILRRANHEVVTVSINGTLWVQSSHGVTVKADTTIEEADTTDADMLLLPGGMPGATHLNQHEGVRKALLDHDASGKLIGAICAAPMVLGTLGLLKGRRATCAPGFETYLEGATYTGELVNTDGRFTTGSGAAASLTYAYTLLAQLSDATTVSTLQKKMEYLHLRDTLRG